MIKLLTLTREDTVLFRAFRKIVSGNEYDSLEEEFEKYEHKLFGADGFDTMVRFRCRN